MQSRIEITPTTTELEAALIRLARARAKRYYIAAIFELTGLKKLQPFTAIWGFEPNRQELTLGQMPVPGQIFLETNFDKRELEAL